MSDLRTEAAERLSGLVDAEIAQLSMPSARLVVQVTTADDAVPGAHGIDDVEFQFAANSGTGLRPLHKGASGGELSRLMLALEVVLADRTTVPTLVFDEVDAGIGGKAAVEVGRRLARLAEHAQVIAVTHLPQVAAFAHHHFVVTKDDDGTDHQQLGGRARRRQPRRRARPHAGGPGRLRGGAGARARAARAGPQLGLRHARPPSRLPIIAWGCVAAWTAMAIRNRKTPLPPEAKGIVGIVRFARRDKDSPHSARVTSRSSITLTSTASRPRR